MKRIMVYCGLMKIELKRFRSCDIDSVFEIQRAAFKPVYEKYHDDDTSPYLESRETTLQKYLRDRTFGYLFVKDEVPVGAVRINICGEGHSARVSALCVLPQYQGQGIAQTALLHIERIHDHVNRWFLDTILEEEGNCRLYEKLGYIRTGKTEKINENMTLVFYEKKR